MKCTSLWFCSTWIRWIILHMSSEFLLCLYPFFLSVVKLTSCQVPCHLQRHTRNISSGFANTLYHVPAFTNFKKSVCSYRCRAHNLCKTPLSSCRSTFENCQNGIITLRIYFFFSSINFEETTLQPWHLLQQSELTGDNLPKVIFLKSAKA